MFSGSEPCESKPQEGTFERCWRRLCTKDDRLHPVYRPIQDNVTTIKCLILQHFPVLVYSDNPNPAITSVSVYHKRMPKEEAGQALRIRWYGEGGWRMLEVGTTGR
ncbi:hypothetical protein HDV00_000751, partial [Rhizophlyctis rosea]